MYNPVVACDPGNVLNREWRQEISCQTLARFLEHHLTYSKLIRVQSAQKLPIVYPWDAAYDQLRLGYNRKYSFFPLGIIRCKRTRQVQQALEFCSRWNLHFVVRSSGHSWTAFSLTPDIILDVSQMNKIVILRRNRESKRLASWNRGDRFVTVGPGARLGQVVEKLSAYNLAINVGSCVSVAAAGLTLGAGISPSLIRKAGMTCDHLVAAKVVLASGKVVTVSKTKNPDLFWALQGAGGGNFGVIIELTLHPCPFRGAVVFRYSFPWAQFDSVVENWQSTAPFADPSVSSELDLRSPRFSVLPVEFKGQFEGSLQEWNTVLKKDFTWITSPPTEVKFLKTFAECARFWASTTQSYQKINSLFYLQPMSKTNLNIYKKALESAVGPRDVCSFTSMRGHVSARSPTDSAFPWRQALFWNLNNGSTLDPYDLAEHEHWVDNLYDRLEKPPVPPSYVNGPVLALTVNQKYMEAYYDQNVERLLQVKAKYDPFNDFRFEQSLTTKEKPTTL